MTVEIIYEDKPVELTDEVLTAIISKSNSYTYPTYKFNEIRSAANMVSNKIIGAKIKCSSLGYVCTLSDLVVYHDSVKLLSWNDSYVIIPKGCIRDTADLLNKLADQIEGK